MGLTDSYAYFLPVHALYQIVSIKLCHNIIRISKVKMKSSFLYIRLRLHLAQPRLGEIR